MRVSPYSRVWLAATTLTAATACQNAEDAFASGRIEALCSQSIPICGAQAGCVIGSSSYVQGRFPGGLRVIVRSEEQQAVLVARVLLVNETFPGTELFLRAYDDSCAESDTVDVRDQNLFELAGSDGIIEYHLDLHGRGDHLVELFSDMSAEFLFTLDVEKR